MRRNTTPPIWNMGKTVVVSMDVCALYPSISVSLAMKTILKTIKESKLRWEEIDLETLERYISLTVNSEDLKKHKIKDCVPKAKSRTTLQSWIQPRGTAKTTNSNSQFLPKERNPRDRDYRVMIALAVAHTVKECMLKHFYTFGGHIQRQVDGGAIGSDLTGDMARDTMSQWDKKFIDRLKEAGIILICIRGMTMIR